MTIAHLQSRSLDGAPLASLLVPSRRPHQFEGLIASLHNTISDHRSVEVLVKIDDDDLQAVEAYRAIARNSSINCRLIIGPRLGGVFTLWVGMEEALAQADERAYFVMALTDEGRFLTKGWDDILRSYVGFFDDHAFRLRLSKVTALIQYANYLTCSTMPESFPIFTRRWLELTEGFTRFSYGFDAYQQAIATRLALDDRVHHDIWNSGGRFRDVPIHGIELRGIEFNKDVSEVEACTRMIMGTREWLRLVSYKEQEHMSYLATKLRLYIWAKASQQTSFRLRHSSFLKTVSVEQESGIVVSTQGYRISRLRAYWFYFRIFFGLLPARLRYWRQELLLSRRLRRPSGAPPRVRRSLHRPIAFVRGALGGMRRWGRSARDVVAGLPQNASVRLVWRAIRPLAVPVLIVVGPLARRASLLLTRLVRTAPRRAFRRARRSLRLLRIVRPVSLLIDQLLYPIDRLLWSAPPLLDRYSARNPLGTRARLKRLSYPVAGRDEMLSEQHKIEKLKKEKYSEILY
jgi:hypothetical protein